MMVKEYTDEEIEILSKNPNVFQVTRHNLYLTLEIRQKIYDEWLKAPGSATVKRVLEEDGIDPRMLGPNFCINLVGNFKRSGRPRRMITVEQGPHRKIAEMKAESEEMGVRPDAKPVAKKATDLPKSLLRALFSS